MITDDDDNLVNAGRVWFREDVGDPEEHQEINRSESCKIQIDIDDKTACVLIEQYIAQNLSDASVKVFEELADEIGINLDQIYQAAGKAVLNEAMNIVLAKQLEKIEEDNVK